MDPNDDLLYGCSKLCEMTHNAVFLKTPLRCSLWPTSSYSWAVSKSEEEAGKVKTEILGLNAGK